MIETNEVEDLLATENQNLRFINASWYLCGSEIDAKVKHQEGRLTPATQYFSISEVV